MILTPNTTSKMKLCDAGIIAAMKVSYLMYQMEGDIDLLEKETKQNLSRRYFKFNFGIYHYLEIFEECHNLKCWYHKGVMISGEGSNSVNEVDLRGGQPGTNGALHFGAGSATSAYHCR